MWATVLRVEDPRCVWCDRAAPEDAAVHVKVLSHFAVGPGRVLEEVEVSGPAWRKRVARIEGAPRVHHLSVLESSEAHGRLRVEVDEGALQRAVLASGALPRFPFDVKDGFAQWLIVAPREDAASFVRALREGGARVEVLSSREYRPHESLTDRQRELMLAAIAQGYYEVPRRVTLTKLAERLHVSKSTLSETLARGERRVLEDLGSEAAL